MKRAVIFGLALCLIVFIAGGALADDNEADVYQNGSSNTGNVNQTGDDNYADVYQDGRTNTAKVTQKGDDNTVGDEATPAADGISQVGNKNSATVTQDGDLNKATVDQNGVSNSSVVDQDNTGAVYSNHNGPREAAVYQDGRNNLSRVTQFVDNDAPLQATVTQDGNDNESYVTQRETGGGDSVRSTVVMEQYGTGNYASQSETAPGYNSGQHLIGYQDGRYNDLYQTIRGGYTETGEAHQYGNSNVAYQTMDATHSHAEVIQDGANNRSTQNIWGSNNGYMSARILVDQNGNDNIATQTMTGHGYSHKNHAVILQYANGNEARQTGDGRDLSLVIEQYSNNNDAFITSTGENLTANILQQGGAGNWGSITQGSLGATLNDNGSITQTGAGNTATINQN